MDARRRLHTLFYLACVHRSWTRAELANHLHRAPGKLYENSGNIKLDELVGLADALEWSVDQVARYLFSGQLDPMMAKALPRGLILGAQPPPAAKEGASEAFNALDEQARQAIHAGEFDRALELARDLQLKAQTPEQVARGLGREAVAWDGLGRYTRSLEVLQLALRQHPLTIDRRIVLESNLANAHYNLWDLTSARGVASGLVERLSEIAHASRRERSTLAYSLYVRGNALRRSLQMSAPEPSKVAAAALADLERSCELHEALAKEFKEEHYSGIANTCRGGVLELRVELGQIAPDKALDQILERLDAVIDESAWPKGDWLESYGWWCIFGGNVALRHTRGRQLQQVMGIFTEKALDIADRSGNWALRERVFTMQFLTQQAFVDNGDVVPPFTLDDEDIRLITGTMGRFPAFHRLGWKLIEMAEIVGQSSRN